MIAPGCALVRPSNQASAGVELGPRDRTVMIGASMTRFRLQEPSILSQTEENEEDDFYFAVGGAGRFALE